MLEVAARLVLGGVLAAASVAKLASPDSSRAALAGFGIGSSRARSVVWALLVAAELGLAAGVIAGSATAALLAAALMAAFAATLVGAILRGRAGAPCACFGGRATIGWWAVVRNLGLALAFGALPLLPSGTPSTDEWLALGLAVALLACVALGVAVLALAREVGMLRLRLGPDAALEIPEEGPALGAPAGLLDRFELAPESSIALAVFVSGGCRVCRALEPALASLAGEPALALERFDEHHEAATWERLGIPGSPFAVALDRADRVLAKGTFNNLAQLEGLLAAAERRRAERELAEAAGV